MIKKRYISIYNSNRMKAYFRFFLVIGIILTIFYIIINISLIFVNENSTGLGLEIYNFSQTNIYNSLLPFSIIFYAIAVIFYFFNCQFLKLEKIADEIEKLDNINEKDNKKE